VTTARMGVRSDGSPAVWLIAGPTASGKSALALTLAERTGGRIINADAIQLYADLEILTARPGAEDLARAPHALYGVADGADAWSVGRWLRAATTLLEAASDTDGPLIFVGGTGLYFRALTHGLAEAPAVDLELRNALLADYDRRGETDIREQLSALDPKAAARIAPNDRQRLVRALGVALSTGRPLSDWQADTVPLLPKDCWRGVVVAPDREGLYARIDRRVEAMARAGVVEEVARLVGRALAPDLPVMKAVGFREFAAYVKGAASLDQAICATQAATRRYAKRQLTWFRHQAADWPQIVCAAPADQLSKALAVFDV
jgi:tRNA dimethylallyltransferase